MHHVNGKQIAVIGLGRSGFAAARLLTVHGAHVTVLDDKTPEKLTAWIEKLQALPQVKLVMGGIDPTRIAVSDLVVISPGVPALHPALVSAREKGIPVIGELELAFGYCNAPIAAITGTNGKTTTTTLLEIMINASGKKAIACGNFGSFELSTGDH